MLTRAGSMAGLGRASCRCRWDSMAGKREFSKQGAHLLHLAAVSHADLECDEDADGLRASIFFGQRGNFAHDVALGDHSDGTAVTFCNHD